MSNGDIAAIYGGDFDVDSVDPATGFDVLPAGWYQCQIDKAEIKRTKAGTGQYLHLELTVVGETYNGRKLFPNINLQNPNMKAVEIGMRELAALGLACGLSVLTDTQELLGKVIEARVKVEQQEGYEADNKVTAYRPVQGTAAAARPASTPKPAPAAPRPQPQAAAATTAAPAAKRPWER